MYRIIVPALLLVSSISAFAATPIALVTSGFKLTQAEADRLESELSKKPNNEDARFELLGFYATIPPSMPIETVRKRRLEHILWLIEKDPDSSLFGFAGAAW